MSADGPPMTQEQESPAPHRLDGDAPLTRSERLASGRWVRDQIYRRLLFAAGLVFLAVGAVGMVVPMLPGTVFLILAAWCFTRSSPRFEAWLLNHRYLGPSVVRWRDTGAIPPVVKLFALSSFVGTFTGSWYFGAPTPLLVVLGVVFLLLTVFIATRPNR